MSKKLYSGERFVNENCQRKVAKEISSESYVTVILVNVALAASLFGSELWVTLVLIALVNGLVYNYECTGISINFPNSSHGIIFALVELIGSLFAFVQIPITEEIKRKGLLFKMN